MGIYYSSVGTRLKNYLRHEGLTIEDFAVIHPRFCLWIHHLGKKAECAILERLNELGMEPGKWEGQPNMCDYQVLPFYKAHKEEIRKENPIRYIEKPEPEKPRDDWYEYRRQLAKEIYLLYIKNEADNPINTQVLSEAAADAADALIDELKKEYQ